MKSIHVWALLVIFFASIFFLSLRPPANLDLWFHLKSGELIAQRGILFTDVFSTAQGRSIFPHTWLFQLIIFQIVQGAGLYGSSLMTALLGSLGLGIVLLILRHITKAPLVVSLVLLFIFFGATYEVVTPRPHMIGHLCLLLNLLFLMKFIQTNKQRYLIATLPVTLTWTNSHGSIFLDLYLFIGYGALTFILFFVERSAQWLTKTKTLLLYGLATGILTILPPLVFTQYEQLFFFFQNRVLLSQFIAEWANPETDPGLILPLSLITVGVVTALIYLFLKKKLTRDTTLLLPLLPLLILGFFAIRNLYFSWLVVAIAAGFMVNQVTLPKRRSLQFISIGVVIGMILLITTQIWTKRSAVFSDYPKGAVDFLKNHPLSGNMFNEFDVGGYLLYHLYPDYHVFIDGRTDPYLCCEIPDMLELSVKKNLNDDAYEEVLGTFFAKYETSFVILRTQKHAVVRKIARVLSDTPDWMLVYWDDGSQIFVKNNGNNDAVLNMLGARAATPYNRDPFKTGMEDQAIVEYRRMIDIADSSKSRNAIGYILLQKEDYEAASAQFERAVVLDPTNESPYMNLAELAVFKGDRSKAIRLYTKALELAPDRGLVYIRLGELEMEQGNRARAIQIWKIGLENTVDSDARQQLNILIIH